MAQLEGRAGHGIAGYAHGGHGTAGGTCRAWHGTAGDARGVMAQLEGHAGALQRWQAGTAIPSLSGTGGSLRP